MCIPRSFWFNSSAMPRPAIMNRGTVSSTQEKVTCIAFQKYGSPPPRIVT